MRAAIYVRISLDKRGDGAGVARQRADCQALCAQRGWQVVDVYEDNDRSAYSGRKRESYERLCDDVKAGRIDVVVAWHTDRLWRSVLEQQLFMALAVTVELHAVATMGQEIRPTDADDELLSTLVAAVARKESADKSRRMVRKQREKAERGEFHGGPPGYGYRLDGSGGLVVEPDEARIVREIADRLLTGESQRSVVLDLHRRGVTTSSGRAWRVDDIGKLMRAPRLAGLRVHQGVVSRAKWEPIITEGEHQQLAAQYAARRRGPRQGNPKHLLSGVMRCGRCGAPLSVSMIRGSLRYRCQPRGMGGCGGLSIVAERAEAVVVERFLDYIDGPDLGRAVDAAMASAASHAGDLAGLLQQVQRDRTQLAVMGELLADGTLPADEYRRLAGRLRDRIDAAEETLRRRVPTAQNLSAVLGQGDRLRRAWPAMTSHERREVLHAVVDRVVIHPGSPACFVADRVEVRFAIEV